MSLSESTQYVTDDEGFADGQSEVYVVPSSPHNSLNTLSSGQQGQIVDETALWRQLPHVPEGEVDYPVEVVEQGVVDGFATLGSLERCARCGLRQVDLLSMCAMCKDRLCQTCYFLAIACDASLMWMSQFRIVFLRVCILQGMSSQTRLFPEKN